MKLNVDSNSNTNKSNKIKLFELIVLIYFLVQPLILKWATNKDLIMYIQLVIILYYAANILKSKRIKNDTFFIILILIIFLLINIIKNGVQEYLYKNFIVYGVGNVIILVFFADFINSKHHKLVEKILKKIVIIINVYFFINIPIILLQLNNTYFMMRYHEGNIMYEDHITGLIGANGTHKLTLLWVLLTVGNIYYYKKVKNKYLLIYIILQICFMTVISSYNDNTAFFIIFPILVGQILLLSNKNTNNMIIKIYKTLFYGILAIIISICIVSSNENLQEFYNTRVLTKINQYTNKLFSNNSSIEKDEERIALYKYALENGDGYQLGKGIGSVTYGDDRMPRHFGMSEISIKVYEGGLVYIILLIILYTYYSYKLLVDKKNTNYKRKVIIFISLLIDFILLSIYTQIYRTSELIIFLAITLYVLRMMIRDEEFKYKAIL